jgi:hypothetical protein
MVFQLDLELTRNRICRGLKKQTKMGLSYYGETFFDIRPTLRRPHLLKVLVIHSSSGVNAFMQPIAASELLSSQYALLTSLQFPWKKCP